ncbi:hypothetical protein [Streptomyces sp. NPDC055749]
MRHLGPLELVGDRWVIGDPKRKAGSCLVLTAEGIEHHKHGVHNPKAFVPWDRFMSLSLSATFWVWQATRPAGLLGAPVGVDVGRSGCSLSGIVRHPYEDWSVNYSHHERRYTSAHVFLVKAFFRKMSDAKKLHLLGDPEVLSAAVGRLAPLPVRWAATANRQVSAVVEDLGT